MRQMRAFQDASRIYLGTPYLEGYIPMTVTCPRNRWLVLPPRRGKFDVNADLNLTHFGKNRRSKTDPPGSRQPAALATARPFV